MAINSLSTGFRPGVCTSGTRPTAPYEGQVIYETDTDKTLVWNGSAWLFLSTPQSSEIGAWQSYTPSFVNITVGNGLLVARYSQVNKLVTVQMKFTLGSTSVIGSGGAITMALPVTAVATQYAFGASLIGTSASYDFSAGLNYMTWVRMDSTTTVAFGYIVVGGTRYQEIFATGPMTWAVNDVLTASFTYEAA